MDNLMLMNKESQSFFKQTDEENNSLSFGSDNQQDNYYTNNDNEYNEDYGEDQDQEDDEQLSILSSDKDEDQPTNFMNNGGNGNSKEPNLFMKPPQQTNTGNNYFNTQQFSPQQTKEQIEQEKQEILYQIERLKKRGVQFPRMFSMASSLQEMKAELQRIKRDMEVDASIHFQRKTLVTVISAMEFANKKFNPLQFNLDGWSESINDGINDYDDVFEKLYEKYKSKSQMPPEVQLLMMVAGSGFMTHMTNTLFRQNGNSMTVENLFKNNPDLQKHFASATVDHMANQADQQGGDKTGMMNMFKDMFNNQGGGGSGVSNLQKQSTQIHEVIPPKTQPKMKGPDTSDINNILEELQLTPDKTDIDIDRFETMSAISESKKSQTSMLSSLLSKDKKGKTTITL